MVRVVAYVLRPCQLSVDRNRASLRHASRLSLTLAQAWPGGTNLLCTTDPQLLRKMYNTAEAHPK